MKTPFGLEQSLSFINCQLKPADKSASSFPSGVPKRAVTISRQSGCGAHVVGEKLVQYLQAHSSGDQPPWALFDRNLVEKVLQDHKLPERLARYMPEDRIHEITDTFDELFGLHPSSWMLVERISKTILRLAGLGNVVIIEDTAKQGDGIARIEGLVIFVPDTKVNDQVKIEVKAVKRTCAIAEVVNTPEVVEELGTLE